MNRWLDCIQIWYGCSPGISDDLINFYDESMKNKMAASAKKKKIDIVVVGVIFFSLLLDTDNHSLRLRVLPFLYIPIYLTVFFNVIIKYTLKFSK